MSFSNFEFPNTNFYGSDLRELISMYKKLVKEYDDILEQLNELKTNIGSIVDEYLDADLGAFKAELLNIINNEITELENEILEEQKKLEDDMTKFKNDISSAVEQLRNDINDFEAKVNNRVQTIANQIAQVYIDMAEYKHEMAELFELQKNELILYIQEHVAQITRLYVTNPFTGAYEDIQDVLNDIAKYVTQSYGLTAQEYDDLQLRASEYDAKRITAQNYSSRGILLFFKELYLKMRSPFTGLMDYYDNIIYQLSNLHRGAYTAQEYDNLLLTADDYDALQLSAYKYDWEWTPKDFNGKLQQLKNELINVVEVGNGGLTATQLDNLQLLHQLP